MMCRQSDGGTFGSWTDLTGFTSFGLGATSNDIGDWNNTTATGFYRGMTNSPDGGYWHGISVHYDSQSCVQMAWKVYGGNLPMMAMRKNDGAWEYVNPPMVEGEEYQTTQRWEGNPVYTMLVDGGEVANGKVLDLVPAHDNLGKPIGPFLPQNEMLRSMMERSFDILNNHPVNLARAAKGLKKANSLWFWGAGTRPALVWGCSR